MQTAACQATAVECQSPKLFLHALQQTPSLYCGASVSSPSTESLLSIIFISVLALLWDPNLPGSFSALESSPLGEARPDFFKPRRTPQGQLESSRREVCPSWGTVDSFVNPYGWLLHTGPLEPVYCPQSSMHQSAVGAGYLFIALWTGQRERRN